jgi:hypothetical protein
MKRDRKRWKLIERGVRDGLSDTEISQLVQRMFKENRSPRDIFKLRRQLGLLSGDEEELLKRDRRKLLIGAAGAGIALFGGLAYISLVADRRTPLYDPNHPWAFTQRSNEQESTYNRLNWVEIEQLFVPVGSETLLPESNPRFEETKQSLPESRILAEIDKAGLPRSNEYDLKLKERHYMIPDNSSIAQSVLRYCEEATDFLYSHPELSHIERETVTWVPVKSGDNYESGFGRKGFIGHSYFRVQKVYSSIPEEEEERETMLVARSDHRTGAFLNTDRDLTGSMDNWYILISAAHPSIVVQAPFSELVPVAMTVPSIEYEREHGVEKTILLDEALSEAISHELARELCMKLKIPRGVELVEEGLRKTRDVEIYRLLPHAHALVQRIGIRHAFDLYMDDPNKFEKALVN